MKAILIHASSFAVVMLGLSSSVGAQRYEIEYASGDRDDYIVVERRRSGTIVIEEPAPQVVIVAAPPAPPRTVVFRPDPPCRGAIWVQGYWRYTGARFVWVRGHWIPPRDGYRFVQPRWHLHAGHYYYTPGYFRPYHADVRRASYHRYRPRPGYVYYRGHQRPYVYRHNPSGHHRHAPRHLPSHTKPGRHHPRGHAKQPIHPSYRKAKHPARLEHRHVAPSVRRGPSTPSHRPRVSRDRTPNARASTRNQGRQVATVARGRR